MSNIVKYTPNKAEIIDISRLKSPEKILSPGLISPAMEDVDYEIAPDHAAEPIKSLKDIFRISDYLISHGRYRDNMLFIVGINFGLRASDLRTLRFANLINSNFTFKDKFPVFEKKTRNTRKRKKNRYITINKAVVEAVTLYLKNTKNVSLSDYMFRSESNNGGNMNEPITIQSIDRILKGIANDLQLNVKVSTHTLRKTFCYHQMLMSHNSSRKLMLLQKMLNHSSPVQTLDYIGITSEEIEQAYQEMNLGSKKYNYLLDSSIEESDGVSIYG